MCHGFVPALYQVCPPLLWDTFLKEGKHEMSVCY